MQRSEKSKTLMDFYITEAVNDTGDPQLRREGNELSVGGLHVGGGDI